MLSKRTGKPVLVQALENNGIDRIFDMPGLSQLPPI
jgi:thiamine pyrophosphate-dependent acetolactate synthase large subunit-like protein